MAYDPLFLKNIKKSEPNREQLDRRFHSLWPNNLEDVAIILLRWSFLFALAFIITNKNRISFCKFSKVGTKNLFSLFLKAKILLPIKGMFHFCERQTDWYCYLWFAINSLVYKNDTVLCQFRNSVLNFHY